jgi:protein transport protein SEC13
LIFLLTLASSVNCVQFAPPEYGLILACGSSDGQVTVLESKSQTGNDWEVTAKFSALKSGVSSLSWAAPAESGSLFDEPHTVTKKEIRKRLVCSGNNSTIHIYEEGSSRHFFSCIDHLCA